MEHVTRCQNSKCGRVQDPGTRKKERITKKSGSLRYAWDCPHCKFGCSLPLRKGSKIHKRLKKRK